MSYDIKYIANVFASDNRHSLVIRSLYSILDLFIIYNNEYRLKKSINEISIPKNAVGINICTNKLLYTNYITNISTISTYSLKITYLDPFTNTKYKHNIQQCSLGYIIKYNKKINYIYLQPNLLQSDTHEYINNDRNYSNLFIDINEFFDIIHSRNNFKRNKILPVCIYGSTIGPLSLLNDHIYEYIEENNNENKSNNRYDIFSRIKRLFS